VVLQGCSSPRRSKGSVGARVHDPLGPTRTPRSLGVSLATVHRGPLTSGGGEGWSGNDTCSSTVGIAAGALEVVLPYGGTTQGWSRRVPAWTS